MRKKIALLIGVAVLLTTLAGCKRLEKIIYPTKRSYGFNEIEKQVISDLEKGRNKELVSYFAIDIRKKYGTKEIMKELKNAEDGLGEVRDFHSEEIGKSGHRGGLGETITTWEIRLDTDQGKFYAIVSWSSGDNSKDEKLERETEGIKNLMLYPEEYNNSEGLDQFVDVDFPVLYPGIQR